MKSGYINGILVGLFLCLTVSRLQSQSFVVNGSASALGGDCYQLTPDVGGQAGSIFSQNTIDLTQPFSIDASFFFGCKDGNGADGIVFILTTTNTALGNGGGGLGYEGISPSIAVEYDDYFNGNYSDPSPDHMAVISDGNLNHTGPTSLVAPVNLANIETCMDHCFLVTWDPVSLTLTSILGDNTITYTGDIVTNIFSGNPLVYFGFSSGTGSLSNLHRVCFGPPLLQAMPDVSVCEGESIELQADPNGIAWEWAPDPTLDELDISDPTATPVTTTTYTTIIEYSCGYLGYDTVLVTVNPAPIADASNNSEVCVGETLLLMASGGVDYEWSGPLGYFSTVQNPVINNVTEGMAGFYYVTVTDANGCTSSASTFVEIDLGPEIIIDMPPGPICENSGIIQLTASPAGGIWGGDVTPGGIFDPGYTGEGTHIVSYTSTNSNGCTNTSEIAIEVLSIPDVIITPPGFLCEDADPIQLTGSPPGGIWEGEISLNGIFDPGDAGSGSHLITYTANDANGCTNSEEIIIEVLPLLNVDITPAGPFCVTDSLIMFSAAPSGGIWGGAANSSGIIYPGSLGAGNYVVTNSLLNQNGCYYGEIAIEITAVPDVSINAIAPLCPDVPPQTLTGTPSGGIWSGAANASGQIDPASLGSGNHQVIYEYTFAGGCSGSDTLNVVVLPSGPQINNLNVTCDSLATAYVVTFAISDGDPSSYSVIGNVTGTLIPGNPYIFSSVPIAAGSPYNFTVFDGNQCDSSSISGISICNCSTNAGMMDLNQIAVCENEIISVLPPTGVVLDPNDSLVFILHLGFPDSIILISNVNEFAFAPPLQTGVNYFISTLAGNALPGSGVDPADPCLSVSFGTPVMWVQNPSGFVTGPSTVCSGDSVSLSFILSGNGPFDIIYSDGSSVYSVDSIESGHMVSVAPVTTTTYTLLELHNHSSPECASVPGTSFTIEVKNDLLIPKTERICSGDSIFLGGSYQTDAGEYEDNFVSANGCDSIIQTTLIIDEPDFTYLIAVSCDPAQTGIFYDFLTNQYGCDSTIITTVTFVDSYTTLIESTTCDQQEAGIFTEMYISQEGCDSTVIETILFVSSDTILLSGQTCDAAAAGIFIQNLINAGGCDSTVIETIEFIASDTTTIFGETCLASEAGIFTETLSNAGGCDSLIIETISLLPSDTTKHQTLTCEPQDTGTQVQVYTNIYGCDSLLLTITNLAPYDSCHIPKDIFIPDVFSPNDDGINDLFFVSAGQDVVSKISFFRIFDRWGGLVLERLEIQPNDPDYGWDGTEKGKPVNPGVFVWMINVEYTDGSHETRTGDVTLVR